ncbi:alpha/beta hydrolase [Sphingomonas tagetis]|nr:alpha/beta hydrolase-fold protein [Sphingomonas tagetis]
MGIRNVPVAAAAAAAAAAAIAIAALPVAAQDKAASPAPAAAAKVQPFAMPQTDSWELTSDGGEVYRIFVSFPITPPPADGWPVLYVLDGNAEFAGFAEARRVQEYDDVGKGIVVGVGYPTDQVYDSRRLYDYAPKIPNPPPPGMERFAKLRSGGQDPFVAFLTGKLRAEIARRYTINPHRQSLFGHSLGGLLALHALYTRSDAFNAIVAASPSLAWNGQSVLPLEREFTARLVAGKIARPSRLMVVVGGQEGGAETAASFARRIDRLSGYGLRSQFRLYGEEGHMSVPSRAVTDTLRFVFGAR